MVSSLNKYESVIIINPTFSEEEIRTVIDKVKKVIEGSGQVDSVDEWGKRKLAYIIENHKEGYYVQMHFSANPEFPKELERIYKITTGIIRYMILKKEDSR